MKKHSKVELHNMCKFPHKKFLGTLGNNYIFVMPGFPYQIVYKWNQKEIWVTNLELGTANKILDTPHTMTKTEFEIFAKNTFYNSVEAIGGMVELQNN